MLNVPERTDDQDEVVIEIVLRRTDQPNPGGGSASDIGNLLAEVPPLPVVDALLTICSYFGFDREQSYAGVTSVTDVEGAAEPASLAQLLAANTTPPVE